MLFSRTAWRSWQAGHSFSLTTAASEDSVTAFAAVSAVTEAASWLGRAVAMYFYVILPHFELGEDDAASRNSPWQMQASDLSERISQRVHMI